MIKLDAYEININDNTISFTMYKDDVKSYFIFISDIDELENFVKETEIDVKVIPEMDVIFIENESYDILDAITLKIIDLNKFIEKNL
jgi:hypothetical protein